LSRCRYAGWRDWGEKERGVLWFRRFGPAEASPVSRVPSFRARTPNERRNVGQTGSRTGVVARTGQATWCIVHGTSHSALVASLVPHFGGCVRPRLLLPTTHRNFDGHQTTRHARARSHDLLTTYRVRMGRHVTTLITTVLSRCISQPIMRTPLPAIAAPVLTCPATP
jgi:hypothetical protein